MTSTWQVTVRRPADESSEPPEIVGAMADLLGPTAAAWMAADGVWAWTYRDRDSALLLLGVAVAHTPHAWSVELREITWDQDQLRHERRPAHRYQIYADRVRSREIASTTPPADEERA
jgi:hypothetical protein